MVLPLLFFLAGPPPQAKPQPPVPLTLPVLDTAQMFTRATRERAVARIAELKEKYGFDFIIETVEKQPDMNHLSGLLNTTARNQAIEKWARERADDLMGTKSKGIFMVISKSPLDAVVVSWPDEVEADFRGFRRNSIRLEMRSHLWTNPDAGLMHSLDRFEEILKWITVPESPLGTVPLLIILGSVTGAWVVLALARRQLYRGGPEKPPALYPPAMQGSIFGSPAGLWINDRLFESAAPTQERPA